MSERDTLTGKRDWQPGHDHFWSPLDEQDDELPPMVPLQDTSAIGKVLGIGLLGFSLCICIALLFVALTPAIK